MKRFNRKNSGKYYRINYQIQADKMRLLDEKGKQIGILDKNEALRLAQKEEKDLVEISAKANPPVVKLIDFKKHKYLEAKKERDNKKASKKVDIKEIRMTPFMAEHDFNTRIKRGEEFLKQGNQLKIAIFFRGRAITKKEFGFELAKKAVTALDKISKVVKEAHFEGRNLILLLAPDKKNNEKSQTEN